MKILISGAIAFGLEQKNRIKSLGISVDYFEQESETIKNPEEYEIIVCNNLFNNNSIKLFTNLRCIQLTSAGFDKIDLAYCKQKNICVLNAKGVYSIPIAEWIVLKILEIYKKTFFFIQNQKDKHWQKDRNLFELNGKTATIVGFGSIGQETAKRLRAFGVFINTVDTYKVRTEYNDQSYLTTDIETPLSQSDIVILTLPLTNITYHLFSDRLFEVMKEDAVLINVSRGNVIDEASLIKSVGKFRGIALDVFEEEPLSENSQLWDLPNVIVTPHNSFVSEKNNERLFNLIYENIRDYKGK